MDYKQLGQIAKASQISKEGYHVSRLGYDEWEIAAKAVIEASALRSKLAIAVEALEEMRCSCYPYHKDHDSEDCAAVIAKEALAKIRS